MAMFEIRTIDGGKMRVVAEKVSCGDTFTTLMDGNGTLVAAIPTRQMIHVARLSPNCACGCANS